MNGARVAIVQFPGVNCEGETARALGRVGLAAEIHRWTRPTRDLETYDAFVLPGGFSYQDRVRAGALAAKDPMVEVLFDQAERGKPVLGICNGAQVLIEAGMVPGRGGVELALARNRMPGRTGYYTRWIHVRIEETSCLFTRHLPCGTVLALPVAHGEGRFTGPSGRVARLVRAGLAPLRYATAAGALATTFPDNPNGSEQAVAAFCNTRGNVLAMMPHPERAQDLGAVPRSLGWGAPGSKTADGAAASIEAWTSARDSIAGQPATAIGTSVSTATAADEPGPGLALFEGLRRYLEES